MYIRNRVSTRDDKRLISLATREFNVKSDVVKNILNTSENTLVLCDKRNNIMGFLCYRVIFSGVIFVEYAILGNEYRGRGVATSFLPHLMKYAKERNIRVITGFVRSDYKTSLQTFKKWGFTPVYNSIEGTILAAVI